MYYIYINIFRQRHNTDIGDEIRMTLESMEKHGGPTAYRSIKFSVPQCTNYYLCELYFVPSELIILDQSYKETENYLETKMKKKHYFILSIFTHL